MTKLGFYLGCLLGVERWYCKPKIFANDWFAIIQYRFVLVLFIIHFMMIQVNIGEIFQFRCELFSSHSFRINWFTTFSKGFTPVLGR